MVTPKPPLQMFQYDFDVPTVFLLCDLVNLTLIQIFYVLSGLLIFRAVADPRNSGLSAKFPKKREIPRNPPEIFPNTCRQNIFNTYLGY